jgi:hypothetical protein
MKKYLDNVENRLKNFSSQPPPRELREKLADGYLALASHLQNQDDKRALCQKAKAHMKGLTSQAFSDGYIASCAEPSEPIKPVTPTKPNCTEVYGKFKAKFDEADKLWEAKPKDYRKIEKLLNVILKMNDGGCKTNDIKQIIDRSQSRLDICKKHK